MRCIRYDSDLRVAAPCVPRASDLSQKATVGWQGVGRGAVHWYTGTGLVHGVVDVVHTDSY